MQVLVAQRIPVVAGKRRWPSPLDPAAWVSLGEHISPAGTLCWMAGPLLEAAAQVGPSAACPGILGPGREEHDWDPGCQCGRQEVGRCQGRYREALNDRST